MGNVKLSSANITLEDSGGSYWSESLPTGVVFATNFDNDTAWTDVTPNGNFTNQNTPSNWTGMQRTTGGEFEVRVGGGQSGSNAMRFNYSDTVSLPSMTLFKHLTGRKARGYGRLYLRWNVRLGNNFRASDGSGGLDFWKWCRLLQNVDPNDFNTWSENRVDSHFIVCTWAGSQQWGADMNIIAGSNSGENLASGSAGGNHILLDWYQLSLIHI